MKKRVERSFGERGRKGVKNGLNKELIFPNGVSG
jgi:hypothetical protein